MPESSPWKTAASAVFGLWLALFVGLLLVTAVYDRKPAALLGVGGLLVYGALFGVFWRRRTALVARLRLKSANIGMFLLIGWLAALVVELLLYFTLSYEHGIGVGWDIAYTSPTYLALLAGWWLFLEKHPLSLREVFFIGGLHGLLIEAPQKLLSGQGGLEMLLGAPVHVALYGTIVLVPTVLLGLSDIDPSAPLLKKYAFGLTIVPLITFVGYVLSIGILFISRNLPS